MIFCYPGGEKANATTKARYKYYKKEYKNHGAKRMYQKLKYWKSKGNEAEKQRFNELKTVFDKYKYLSRPERKIHLTEKEFAEYQAYRRYRGYKIYKKLKKEVGA